MGNEKRSLERIHQLFLTVQLPPVPEVYTTTTNKMICACFGVNRHESNLNQNTARSLPFPARWDTRGPALVALASPLRPSHTHVSPPHHYYYIVPKDASAKKKEKTDEYCYLCVSLSPSRGFFLITDLTKTCLESLKKTSQTSYIRVEKKN